MRVFARCQGGGSCVALFQGFTVHFHGVILFLRALRTVHGHGYHATVGVRGAAVFFRAGNQQQGEDGQEHQPLQHIVYDSGKFFGGDILPVQEIGKLVFGQLLLHLYVLVDAAHHRPLALMQPAAAMAEGDGKPCDGKQGCGENKIQVHLFHVITGLVLTGDKSTDIVIGGNKIQPACSPRKSRLFSTEITDDVQ